jgi:MSHA pilin protein MshA
MRNSFKKSAEAGFTLIELIVVIVILGILAATALPKFMDMGGEARVASLNAAVGSVKSSVAMLHGKWLIAKDDITVEGTTVPMDDLSGLPLTTSAAATALSTVAGLSDDYDVIAANASAATADGSDKNPATGANQLAIIPKSARKTSGDKCYIFVNLPVTANGVASYGPLPLSGVCN